ncbi:MAG: tetratricopeptide repeat protein [bacterium]
MIVNFPDPQQRESQPGPSNRTAIVAWIVLLALLFPALSFLVRHPGWFLATEERQPSRGLIRGSELEKEGRYDDALEAYKGALGFYQEQLAKTGAPNHRMAVATTYHKMGLALLKRRLPGDEELARQCIQQGVEVEPSVGRGEGQYLLGDLEREHNPESALTRYAGVIAAASSGVATRIPGRCADILVNLERWDEAFEAYQNSVAIRSWEPDQETSSAFVAVAERIGRTTGTALGRAYLQLNQKEKALGTFKTVSKEDPVARWYQSEIEGREWEFDGIVFAPSRAFAASAGIDSVSFTWPAGCVVEFISGENSKGRNLAITLQPDRLRPQPIQLHLFLNGENAGQIEVNRGDPSDHETNGTLLIGRNVLEIRCGNAWFEPEDRPVITLLGLKPDSESAER